jgi:predicted RecB family nuclease
VLEAALVAGERTGRAGAGGGRLAPGGLRSGEPRRRGRAGGTLIGHEYWRIPEKVADTQAALVANAPAIFEAAFLVEGVYAAVDVLERLRHGHALIEVKSTTKLKDQHIPDVAIQLHVLREAGVAVSRAELMHLNSDCRFPDLSDLFVREDVTRQAETFLPSIPAQLAKQKGALAGKLPVVEVGPHCTDPYECPFMARCWPRVGDDHVSNLYSGRRTAEALIAAGVESIKEIPANTKLSAIQARQVLSVKSGRIVVEDGLASALATLAPPIAYLDFETIVQMSCHVVGSRGAMNHFEHLADGPEDPRPAMAEAVVHACDGAQTVVAYNAPFERRCLEHLAQHVPSRRAALKAVAMRLVDLLPIVRNHVYHPGFGGGFGMKAVAPALVDGLDYSKLEIGEGGTASTILEALLLRGDQVPAKDRTTLREQLIEYCKLDTLAMVKVVERLSQLR